MIGDLNGTKAIIEIDFDDGFFSTIGQIEFTQSYNASPIEISNKSYLDYVTYLDEGLSSIQFNLSGNIIYNSDLTYRRLRSFANLSKLFNLRIINLKDNAIISEYKAIVSNMADNAQIGSAVSTSITFLSTFVDESIAKGIMKLAITSNEVGFSTIEPGFSQSEISNDSFIKNYGVITEIRFKRVGGFYEFFFRVLPNSPESLSPKGLKVVIAGQTIFVRASDQSYWTGNPGGELWVSKSAANNQFPDRLLAPATGCEILYTYLITNFINGDEVEYNIFPAKPEMQLINTKMNAGQIINSSQNITVGFSIDDAIGSLSVNYYSDIIASQIDSLYITQQSIGVFGNFSLVLDQATLGQSSCYEINIDGQIYWVANFLANKRFILNSSDLCKEKIFNQIQTSINDSKQLNIKMNPVPYYAGIGTMTTDSEESLGIKKVGLDVDNNQGNFIPDRISSIPEFQEFTKFFCVVDNTNSLGSITIEFQSVSTSGNTRLLLSPRGDEFTQLKIILDNTTEYMIPIKQPLSGSFSANEYFLDDFEIAKNLMSYFEDATTEGRRIITQCSTDNNEKFINK